MLQDSARNLRQSIKPGSQKRMMGWKITYVIIFVITAGLNMLHIRAGFWTSYAADIVVPAWLYIVIRGLHPAARTSALTRYLGTRSEVTALD